MWVFLYMNYSKFWSVSLEHFIERKPLISEEWFGLSKIKMYLVQAHSCFHCTDNDGNRMAQRKLKQRFDDIVSIIGRQKQSVPKISRSPLSNKSSPINLYPKTFFRLLSVYVAQSASVTLMWKKVEYIRQIIMKQV